MRCYLDLPEHEDTMSEVLKLEKLENTPYMKARLTLDSVYYVDAEYTSHAYKCTGCGLVWDRKNLALSCESHGHKPMWRQLYGGYFENGKHVGGAEYERRAIRREKR